LGEVFVKVVEKKQLPDFEFFRRGGIGAWPSQKAGFRQKAPKDFNSKDRELPTRDKLNGSQEAKVEIPGKPWMIA